MGTFGVATCVALLGGILLIVTWVGAPESIKIGFESENKASVTLKATADDGASGYTIHIKASDHAQCEDARGKTAITDPSGADVLSWSMCSSEQAEWEANNDPPLRTLGYFTLAMDQGGAPIYGDYIIASSLPLWIVDTSEESIEAVGGILGMLGLFVTAVVVLVVSSILCCVACCCMCSGESVDGTKQQQGKVV